MRFSVAAVLAFAASAFAQTPDFDPVYTPKKDETVTAGSSFTLTWDAPPKYVDGTISIELIGGATQNTQQPIAKIASGVKNSAKTYTWNVDAALGDKNVYGLVFKLDSDPSVFQYSNPFHIKASGSKSTGSDAVTLTTSQGVKTILLSSTTPTSTAAPSTTCTGSNTSTTSSSSSSSTTTTAAASTTTSTTASSAETHHDAIANCTTLVKSTSSQSTPATVAPSGSIPGTTTTPMTPISTAAASAVRAGSLTILGVVAAFLAF